MTAITGSPISEYGMYRHLTRDGLRAADTVDGHRTVSQPTMSLPPHRLHSLAMMTGASHGLPRTEEGEALDARGAAHRREIAAMQLYQARLEQQLQTLRKDKEVCAFWILHTLIIRLVT